MSVDSEKKGAGFMCYSANWETWMVASNRGLSGDSSEIYLYFANRRGSESVPKVIAPATRQHSFWRVLNHHRSLVITQRDDLQALDHQRREASPHFVGRKKADHRWFGLYRSAARVVVFLGELWFDSNNIPTYPWKLGLLYIWFSICYIVIYSCYIMLYTCLNW